MEEAGALLGPSSKSTAQTAEGARLWLHLFPEITQGELRQYLAREHCNPTQQLPAALILRVKLPSLVQEISKGSLILSGTGPKGRRSQTIVS